MTANGYTGSTSGGGPIAISDVTGLTAALADRATDAELTTGLATKAATAHTHAEADVTGLTAALAAKAPLASPTFTGTVSGVTASMVGLGNVTNTSDVNKPVSTAQQTALDAKMAITGGNGFTLGNGGVVVPAGASRMDVGFSGTVEGAGLEMYKDDHATRPGGASFVYGAGAPGVGSVRFIHYDGVDYYVRAEHLPDGGVKIYNTDEPDTPTDGGVVYVQSGVLKYIDPAGDVSTLSGGGGGSSMTVKRAIVTSGDITPQNTSSAWQALTGGPTLSLAAAAGDYITVEIMGMLNDPASNTFIELAVTAGGTLVRYGSSGTGTPAVEGDPAFYPDTVNFSPVGPPMLDFVAQAGDINGGNVTVCLAVNSAGSGKIYASAAFPLRWRLINHGAVSVS